MTTEEAITFAENAQLLTDEPVLQEFYRLAGAALRAQQEAEKNAPLTLDELQKMGGEKIFIQYIGACKGFYEDEWVPYYGKHEKCVEEFEGELIACILPLKYYGKSWLAYRHKPKEGSKC